MLGGPLKRAQDITAKYLWELEPDRMLAYYRIRAGLRIYTPPGHDANAATPYPLIVAFDGDEYRDTMPLPMVLDTLLAAKKRPRSWPCSSTTVRAASASRTSGTPPAWPTSSPSS